MKGVNLEKLLLYTGIGVGIYALARVLGFAGDAGKALTTAGEAVGSGLYDYFHPDTTGDMLYYVVRFADGTHAVPASNVADDGTFSWSDGKTYRIMDSKTVLPGAGAPTNRIAVPV